MSKKPGMLPKLEFLLIAIFFLAFLLWAASKCSSTRRAYQIKADGEAMEKILEDSLSLANRSMLPDTSMQPRNLVPEVEKERVTVLYATIDGVNVRSGPGLNHRIIERIKLYDEVIYLGEVTDFTQEVKLGEITTNEPWIKVRTRKKQDGWVYGAGLSYYKKQLEGAASE